MEMMEQGMLVIVLALCKYVAQELLLLCLRWLVNCRVEFSNSDSDSVNIFSRTPKFFVLIFGHINDSDSISKIVSKRLWCRKFLRTSICTCFCAIHPCIIFSVCARMFHHHSTKIFILFQRFYFQSRVTEKVIYIFFLTISILSFTFLVLRWFGGSERCRIFKARS
jgi:hypothetical protein